MSQRLLYYVKSIVRSSGFAHDFGKCSNHFQQKLLNQQMKKDDVRHEWLSLFIADGIMKGKDWNEVVKSIEEMPQQFCDAANKEETLIFKNHISNFKGVVLFCIATHHRLPKSSHKKITNENHVNQQEGVLFDNPKISFFPSQNLLELFKQEIKLVEKLDITSNSKPKYFFRAIAIFSRMALILADQSVSAEWHPADVASLPQPIVYANTMKRDGVRVLNQELSWHLERVGRLAAIMAERMLSFKFPSMSRDTFNAICQPSIEQFAWQNRTVEALSSESCKYDGHLVFVIAGTGTGKTIGNLKIAAALRKNDSLRITTAMNLRTLTLQTAQAYLKFPGINRKDIALVIGESLAIQLQKSLKENEDEDEVELSPEIHSEYHHQLPDWLSLYSKKNPKLGSLLMAPLVVSTIDFIIAAGEPHRMHHHILASMRIMHSDLILDEIDGYDPKALLAVLRLVTEAGRWGRNVIASSATLSKPVARLLWQAYDHGMKMRASIEKKEMTFQTVVVDDKLSPSFGTFKCHNEFLKFYQNHVQLMLATPNTPIVVPELIKIQKNSKKNQKISFLNAIISMHKRNHFLDSVTEKKISIGLVRVANIKTAILVADEIANTVLGARVCCYHSNISPLHRFLLEERLDYLLTRKGDNPNEKILNDPDIRSVIDKDNRKDILFIVVATPIEEIGRDHDFDWGIAEPSSSQSIVQIAGRIKRHRRIAAEQPNFGILQYCYKEIVNKDGNYIPVFTNPGLEQAKGTNKTTHRSHDLEMLFDWKSIKSVTAAMRFDSDRHAFAADDDKAIEYAVRKELPSMLTKDHLWMALDTYTESSLRKHQKTIEIRPNLEEYENSYLISAHDFNEGAEVSGELKKIIPAVSNAWLSWSDESLLEISQQRGLDIREALSSSIQSYRKNNMTPAKEAKEAICRHLSFGYFYCKDS